MTNLQEKPLLFISHKHADGQIASKLANFIRFSSQNRVKVYLSSDPDYIHPEYGRSLNNELRNALGEADALILIFTSEDQDWSYCMWECGVATDPKTPPTNIDEQLRLSLKILAEHGVIVESNPLTPQLFGMAYFQPKTRFKDLIQMWKNKYPDAEPQWFTSCCEQFREGVSRGRPVIRESHLKEVDGEREYTPVLSRIRRIPLRKMIELDIYFYYLSDPRGVSVTSIMIPNGSFFMKNLGQIQAEMIKLDKLIEEIESLSKNRVPLLNSDGCPLYIVHRSMIDQFIAKQAMKGKVVTDLTLANLLDDDVMKRIFETTFIVVSERASMAEAKSAMLSVRDCRDVFVTAGGTKNEPLLGWITNVRLVARLPGQHRFT